MDRYDRRLRWLVERWPLVIVVPAFVTAGYTWVQVFGLAVLATVLAELAFAFVKVLLLDRE